LAAVVVFVYVVVVVVVVLLLLLLSSSSSYQHRDHYKSYPNDCGHHLRLILFLVENEMLFATLARGTSYEALKWYIKYSISVDGTD